MKTKQIVALVATAALAVPMAYMPSASYAQDTTSPPREQMQQRRQAAQEAAQAAREEFNQNRDERRAAAQDARATVKEQLANATTDEEREAIKASARKAAGDRLGTAAQAVIERVSNYADRLEGNVESIRERMDTYASEKGVDVSAATAELNEADDYLAQTRTHIIAMQALVDGWSTSEEAGAVDTYKANRQEFRELLQMVHNSDKEGTAQLARQSAQDAIEAFKQIAQENRSQEASSESDEVEADEAETETDQEETATDTEASTDESATAASDA